MFTPAILGSEGAGIAYLAKAKAGAWPAIDQVAGNPEPAFKGDPAAFIEKHGATDAVKRFLTNKVKKCEQCGKPNAFTLDTCNSCGKSLVQTPIGSSNNVFMGFVFGIEKGPFPFTVSVRRQCEKTLVIDDLLALSPLHFNVIPTTQYIPDWRYLLRRPKDGDALVKLMLSRCAEATEPFLKNEAWCKKVFAAGAPAFDLKDICAGFNYPPSQYQLHIQYMLPLLTPFHYANAIKGVHYTNKRFFPVGYVQQCIECAATKEVPKELLQEDTPIDEIINYFEKTHDVNYDKALAAFMANFKANSQKYAGWAQEDFEGSVVELRGKAQFFNADGTEDTAFDLNAVTNADKAAMQNYGRPYKDGKPTGSFYGFPKQPGDLESWI